MVNILFFKNGDDISPKEKNDDSLCCIFYGLASFMAGDALLENKSMNGILWIFPAINMVYGLFLLSCVKSDSRFLNKFSSIPEEPITIKQKAANIIILVAIFFYHQFVLRLDWALTASISLGYAAMFNKLITRTLKKPARMES